MMQAGCFCGFSHGWPAFLLTVPEDCVGCRHGITGNIRTQAMRAFSADEMKRILDKLPTADFTSHG